MSTRQLSYLLSSLPLMPMERDWIEWIVDIGGALGGFASLLAIVLAIVTLNIARQDRADASAERKEVRRGRQRAHNVALLEALHGLMPTLHNLNQAFGESVVEDSRASLKSTLSAYGLRERLPLTYALTEHTHDRFPPGDAYEERNAAREEILNLIELEAERAHAV